MTKIAKKIIFNFIITIIIIYIDLKFTFTHLCLFEAMIY